MGDASLFSKVALLAGCKSILAAAMPSCLLAKARRSGGSPFGSHLAVDAHALYVAVLIDMAVVRRSRRVVRTGRHRMIRSRDRSPKRTPLCRFDRCLLRQASRSGRQQDLFSD